MEIPPFSKQNGEKGTLPSNIQDSGFSAVDRERDYDYHPLAFIQRQCSLVTYGSNGEHSGPLQTDAIEYQDS